MSEVVSFKSGKDIGQEPVIDDDERLTCEGCRASTSAQAAYDSGWQLAPPLCPACRAPTLARAEACCYGVPS